ncbi:hypothetical protein [Mesonia aquimarina]|nr:hypothetical protein [Mesonia aquimarina]
MMVLLFGILIGVILTLVALWLWVLENDVEEQPSRKSTGEVYNGTKQ